MKAKVIVYPWDSPIKRVIIYLFDGDRQIGFIEVQDIEVELKTNYQPLSDSTIEEMMR